MGMVKTKLHRYDLEDTGHVVLEQRTQLEHRPYVINYIDKSCVGPLTQDVACDNMLDILTKQAVYV